MGQLTQINPELVNGVLLIDTTTNWMRNDTIPGVGIICIERLTTGSSRFKIGNGVDLYRNLSEPRMNENPLETHKTTLPANTLQISLPFEYDIVNPDILVFLNNVKQEKSSLIYTDSTHITLTESSPIDLAIEIIKIPQNISRSTSKRNQNYIIDGNFDFWYEGDTQSNNGYGSATMWYQSTDSLGTTNVHTKGTFSVGELFPDGVPCPKYYSRTTFVGSTANDSFTARLQWIEDLKRLAGKTVTLRFYARSIDGPMNLGVEALQSFGTGGTPTGWTSGFFNKVVVIGEQWTQITLTFTIPNVIGKTFGTNDDSALMLCFWYHTVGTVNNARSGGVGPQSGIIDITSVSLVEGTSEVLPLETSTQEDLEQVSRYYQVLANSSNAQYYRIAQGVVSETTLGYFIVPLKVPMRNRLPILTVTNMGYFSIASGPNAYICTSIVVASYSGDATIGQMMLMGYATGPMTNNMAGCIFMNTVGGKMSLDSRM